MTKIKINTLTDDQKASMPIFVDKWLKIGLSTGPYAGLDVACDGKGRSRKQEHLVNREYTTADGEIKERRGITFNPFLKTKLMGVLATSFLRVGENPYRTIYDNYKHRLQSKWGDERKGHIHNASLRYMVKIFLIDLYSNWRQIEGLPVSKTYQEAKLGHAHGVAAE